MDNIYLCFPGAYWYIMAVVHTSQTALHLWRN